MGKRRWLIVHALTYTLYGLVAFVVLLYVMFPYELLRQRIVAQFRREDLRLTIARLRPDFPLGVELQQVRLLTHRQPLPGRWPGLRHYGRSPISWRSRRERSILIAPRLYNCRLEAMSTPEGEGHRPGNATPLLRPSGGTTFSGAKR